MPKKQAVYHPNLFEPQTQPSAPENSSAAPSAAPSAAAKIDNPCPRCGARGYKSVRPQEHDGLTHYCSAGCLSDDRTDAFYFTPQAARAPTFDAQAEREEEKKRARGAAEREPELVIQTVYEDAKIPDKDVLMLGCSATEIPMANASVQCIVTSPPYWALRKYAGEQDVTWKDGEKCPYGLEPNVEMYIRHSVQILRELRRVLRGDGVLFWNLGDSYAGSTTIGSGGGSKKQQSVRGAHFENDVRREFGNGIKPKDLCLIPQRIAIAAQEDGWWIRSMIIWAKPNPMPESCTDRPTDAYEHIIMMTKSEQYFWDSFAVGEEAVPAVRKVKGKVGSAAQAEGMGVKPSGNGKEGSVMVTGNLRNLRNVWNFATQPYSGAHFATFPEELPRRCILAASSEKGCCAKCGAPYERQLEDTPEYKALKDKNKDEMGGYPSGALEAGRLFTNNTPGHVRDQITTGWQKTCLCPGDEIKPCVILDPFGGSGTTGRVAIELNRRAVLVDITYSGAGYKPLAEERLSGVQRQMIYG
jgi:DNA modification methylase